MSFVSIEFLIFLAVLLLVYYIVPKRVQWAVLLLASLVFYAFAGVKFLAYIFGIAATTYAGGLLIGRKYEARDSYLKGEGKGLEKAEKKEYKAKVKSKARLILILCLIADLGVLAVVKYTGFVLDNINAIFNTSWSFFRIALPLGLSFYTFQSLGYVIDVYRGKYSPQKNPAKYLLFVSFFPQLLQGPISRYDELSQTLYGPHRFDGRQVTLGLWRVLWGFFKKLVVADRLVTAVIALSDNSADYKGAYVVALVFFYALQLYADFTGGIDITIGVAQMLGIKVAENFDRPFFSKNVTEYWRRWHITMGTWFRDYIFYPVSVSGWMLKISKKSREKLGQELGKRIPVYLSTIIVWFLTGLWHGSAWNYIVWGLLNCLVIIISQELEPLYGRFHSRFRFSNTAGYDVFQMVRTFWLMSFIRIFDVYQNVPLTFKRIGTVFTTANWKVLFNGSLLQLGLSKADYAVALTGAAVMLAVSIIQSVGPVKRAEGQHGIILADNPIRERLIDRPWYVKYLLIGLLLAVILVFGAYGIGYDSSQFIYVRF